MDTRLRTSAGGWKELGRRRSRCSRLQTVRTFQFAGHQLVGAFVVLSNTSFTSLGLTDGFHHPCATCVAVAGARARASVSANVRALDTAVGVAVSVEVLCVDAHVAGRSYIGHGVACKLARRSADHRSFSGRLRTHGPGRGDTLGVVHNVRVRRQAVAEEHSLGPLGAHVAIWIVHGALGRELVEHPALRNSGCYT